MKRLNSSDCTGGDDDRVNSSHVYAEEFQAMLDDEGGGFSPEKKRRLSIDQVRALEKNFEVENKLEPERKLKLAVELGLQPRQVAVWFQNRRARWKTKQLERDYGVLKADYDCLKLRQEKLHLANKSLLKEIKELKEKLRGEDGKTTSELSAAKEDEEKDPKCEETIAANEIEINVNFNDGDILLSDYKDGSCDSNSISSAIFNNSNDGNGNINRSPQGTLSSSAAHQLLCGNFHVSSLPVEEDYFVKIEEHDFFGNDEDSGANLMFSDDESPSLPWICSDEWN